MLDPSLEVMLVGVAASALPIEPFFSEQLVMSRSRKLIYTFRMTHDLLTSARGQVERSSLPVRAAARMRISRVDSATDRGRARVTFEMALAEARSLPGHSREMLLNQAQEIAAAIAPELVREIETTTDLPADHRAETLLSIMLQHRHLDAAFEYVVRFNVPFGFPFSHAANLMRELALDRRITVLRSAINAWRESLTGRVGTHHTTQAERDDSQFRRSQLQSRFVRLFGYHWRILPREEALETVRGLLRTALEGSDPHTSICYPDGIRFSSSREHALFEIFHVLRHLDSTMAKSLIVGYAELATAVERYQHGLETIREEAEREAEKHRQQMPASGETGASWIFTGGGGEYDREMSLYKSQLAGDYGPSLEYALELYREDINPDSPNDAQKTFWPSTTRLRITLHSAGKHLGSGAAALLDNIPDPDLRLFAQIELAASLAGLPALPETSMKQSRLPAVRGTPMRAPDGTEIRCPGCRWVPIKEARWPCRCGHFWNTFDTGGVCPSCKYQWNITQCQKCRQIYPHNAWYRKE